MDKNPHLVKWSTVCENKRNGGLGVRDLSILNRALLCKLIWRFANEKNALWRNVISWKFGEDRGDWVSCAFRGAFGTSVWKEIRKEWDTVFPHVVFSQGMVEGWASGKTFGAERRLFVILSPLYMFCLSTRRHWWLICETLLRRKEDGSLALLDLSMIRNWMRSFVFSIPYKESKLLRAKRTRCFSRRQKMGVFW